MKKLNLWLVVTILLTACSPTLGGEAVASCRALVDGMATLKSGMEIPKYFLTDNPAKQGGEFDVMQYFDVLDHLSMQPGYLLDYVYHYDGMGGYPVLYTYPTGQPPYITETGLDAGGGDKNYLENVQVDDTPESYFQFALLALMGNQFYLDWHANYNDAQIVCDRASVDKIIANLDGSFGQRIPAASQVRAKLLLNVEPSVILGEQTVEVRLVTFTKWGGFYLKMVTISRSAPHTIQAIQDKLLVPYNCGVMF
jgi:hypothetical protein